MKESSISRFTFVLAFVMLLIGLFACDQLEQIFPPPQTEPDVITVGVVLPLSGDYAATYGEPMLNGFELARQEINSSEASDVQIEFIPKDDRATVDGAVTAFNELIEQDGVPVILGPGFSSQFKETSLVANEHGVVGFSSTSSASGLNQPGDFNFRAGLITSRLNPPGVDVTHAALGYQQVATIYDEGDTYSTIGHDDLTEALKANNVTILATETFNSKSGDTDFATKLGRLMEENPEAIFVSALSLEMTPILIKSRELGITPSIQLIIPELTNIEVNALVEAGMAEAAEGVISFTGWGSHTPTLGNQDFVQNYRAAYNGADSNPWVAQSYATLHILAQAIAIADSVDPAAIRGALEGISVETIMGTFAFDENGDAVYDSKILIVKNGQLEVFQ